MPVLHVVAIIAVVIAIINGQRTWAALCRVKPIMLSHWRVIGSGIACFIAGAVFVLIITHGGTTDEGKPIYPLYDTIVDGEKNVSGADVTDPAIAYYCRGLENGWDVYYATIEVDDMTVYSFNCVVDHLHRHIYVDPREGIVDCPETEDNEVMFHICKLVNQRLSQEYDESENRGVTSSPLFLARVRFIGRTCAFTSVVRLGYCEPWDYLGEAKIHGHLKPKY